MAKAWQLKVLKYLCECPEVGVFMVGFAFLRKSLLYPTISLTGFVLLVATACTAQGPLPTSKVQKTCADSTALNQAVWSANGIARRQALKTLGVCGQEHWNLRLLMAPLPELAQGERSEAWINVYTALDPKAVARPERITEFLLARAGSSDPEERRLAILGLGGLLESRFSVLSLKQSQTALLNGLKDPDYRVRITAAEAFSGWLGFDDSPDVRAQLPTLLRPLASALLSRTSDSAPEVRAASVEAISKLARLGKFDGLPQPLVTTDQLLRQLEPRLLDQSAQVRLAAVKALQSADADQLSPSQKDTVKQRLLFLIQDQDLEVVMAAESQLDQSSLPELVSLIQSGRLSPTTATTVLSPALMDLPAGHSLLQALLLSPDLSLRINAQRAINAALSQRGELKANDQVVKSKITFGEGLRSSDPAIQIDAITGLSELEGSSESIALLRPSLSSQLLAVKWAAAIAISNFNQNDETTFNSLHEILETSSDDDLRRTASERLGRSQSANAARILGQTAQKDSRDLIYVRSCSAYGIGFPEGQHHVGVDAMTRPDCRRAIAESFSYIDKKYEADVVNALLRTSETRDDDQRFNAIYALGSMVGQTDSITKPKLSDRITALLMPITTNQQEHPEVRRIAATMLHLHRQPMPEFFSNTGLPSPATACANPLGGRGPGYSFDPYEGRCMYDTRTGCGDGLPEVYSTLKRMLGQRKVR
jgi:hypothetical protein